MLSRLPKSTRILLAFASVYLFWGSTYSAIHIAGELLPVAVVSGTRSLISATLIAIIALGRGKSLRVPAGEGWRLAVVGLLFMSANNMLLTWGETMMPSGMSSLIVCTMPIMIALLEAFLPGGTEQMNLRGWVGTLLGTVGIGVLVWPSLHGEATAGETHPALGTTILLVAALASAIGAVLSRRFLFKADAFVATGWQIGAAAIFNLTFAVATRGFHRAVWTPSGIGAIGYLSIFGSLFGLVSFTYLVQNVPVTQVATYAFVNPVIAVLIGVFLLHERLVSTEIAGVVIIVGAVAMVVLSRAKKTQQEIVVGAGEMME